MIVCDIDGCIFGNFHRANLVPENKGHTPNWTAFNEACVEDEAIIPVINLVKHLARAHKKIVFFTSRGYNVRKQTKEQLFGHFYDFGCKLMMRPMNDHRDTIDYKRDVFLSLSHEFTDSTIIIDDHPGIIKMVSVNFPQVNRILVPSFDCTVINERE
jgi:hypothetical protein